MLLLEKGNIFILEQFWIAQEQTNGPLPTPNMQSKLRKRSVQTYKGIQEKSLLRILFIKYPVNLIHVYLRLMVMCINLTAP